jgi:dTDP-L-rhamnose 4-epimerase
MYEIDHYSRTNIGGTALLLDILANQRHAVKKIVLASSRSIYGEGAYDCASCGRVFPRSRTAVEMSAGQWELSCPKCAQPVNCIATPEDSLPSPASIYAVTKLSQEHLIGIGSALGIATVILRFQNVYGEGQSLKNPYTGILSIFSNRIRLGKTVFLFEDGNESRDFVHVSDVANAVCLATELPDGDGKTLNVGSGIPTSVSRVAKCLTRSLGYSQAPVISHEYRLGDIRHCYADLTRIGQALGFVPEIGLDEGLDRFARWVMTQPVEEDKLDLANRQLAKRGLMVLKESFPC